MLRCIPDAIFINFSEFRHFRTCVASFSVVLAILPLVRNAIHNGVSFPARKTVIVLGWNVPVLGPLGGGSLRPFLSDPVNFGFSAARAFLRSLVTCWSTYHLSTCLVRLCRLA